ncbi:MAG: bacillithiol biosynthesis cysteine-adding enzyme BshC [Saprospiraceae bacterium]|nr:bacillithiol biosynthesis cysteine-adding enzyme BshC [Saprospiraceae bacterium]
MRIEKIDYEQISAISSKDLSYIQLTPFLEDFYSFTPSIESFSNAISERKKHGIDRKLLVDVLQENYKSINPNEKQIQNIGALKSENTFTIITAHQPSLLGGPLYYVLKIASVINLCNQLTEAYPEYNFVPTFISGGEDHDFEEIDHLHLFGKTIKWEREAIGPVGRLTIDGIDEVLQQVSEILGDRPEAVSLMSTITGCLEESHCYSDFVFKFVNVLYGKYGVIVVNMDNIHLKKRFAPLMQEEILNQVSKPLVSATQEQLEKHKFKAQAFPRDINLFYLCEDGRKRIEPKGDNFDIVDTNLEFTKENLLKELENHPDRFSPNVVMRPLFQEFCLPNLAYVGGGGEIAYWLERKTQFAHFNVFFPMLIRRNSAMILNKGQLKNLSKLDFTIEDIFLDQDQLIFKFINASSEIEIKLDDQKTQIENAYQDIAKKSTSVDPSLAKSVLAEMTRQLKNIDQMESRIKRSLKSQQDVNVKKIEKLKEKLFPNLGLQERYDNFLPHYLSIGESFFDVLIENLDPMDRRFTCIMPD